MTAFDAREGAIARAPGGLETGMDRGFRILAFAAGFATIGLLVSILFIIGEEALPAMRREGFGFLTSNVWAPGRHQFGILAEIWGTLYSSLLALAIAGFFGVAMALFLTQDFLPPRVAYV